MSTSYYESDPAASRQQYGGVSLWSMGQATHQVKARGSRVPFTEMQPGYRSDNEASSPGSTMSSIA